MARVLFAWECGTTYGHLARQVPIAEAARSAGHQVVFATRDTRVAAEVLGRRNFRFVQAPILQPQHSPSRPLISYADILADLGYTDRQALWGGVQCWLSLFSLVRPDLVEVDHAPTALLACRIAGIAALPVGNGFEIPPLASPLPSIRPWQAIAQDQLLRAEADVVAGINDVSRALRGPEFDGVMRLFETPMKVLATFAELDHYGQRSGEDYRGPIYSDPGGIKVDWPALDGPRVFAYLRPSMRHFQALVTALGQLPGSIICAAPGLATADASALSTPHLRIVPHPCALEPIVKTADCAVSYGGIGTLSPLLLAGIPLVLVPQMIEQYLICQRVAEMGAGILVSPNRVERDFPKALSEILENPSYRNSAGEFAGRYAGYDPQQAVETAVRMIQGILSGTATNSE